VTRRYIPDPDALGAALAARVDQLDHTIRSHDTRLTGLAGDVTALGRGVADLTAQIRRTTGGLPQPRNGSAPGSPSSGATGSDGGEEEGQPDWVAVDDPDLAREWLTGLAQWTDTVLRTHGVRLNASCWLLHPDVVAELLALRADRDAAYTGDRPTLVSEWLARWLPGAADRVATALAACITERGHRHQGSTYDATGLDPASVATWWTTDRATPAPVAFALPRLA
jgi:hypothetical protein